MLPEPVRQKLKEVLQKLPAENAKPFVAGLTGAKWEECRCMLKNILGEDDGGMKILACMLWAAGYSECKYRAVSYTHLDVYKRQVTVCHVWRNLWIQ